MTHYIKRSVELMAVLLITALITFVMGNRYELENILKRSSQINLFPNDLMFYNWDISEDGSYLSQEDPQIIIYNVNNYINNLQINIQMNLSDEDSDEIRIYYTESEGSEFNDRNVLIFTVDKTQKTLDFHIDRQVCDLRIDLTETANTLLNVRSIHINPRNCSVNSMDCLLWIIMLMGCGIIFHFRKLIYSLYEERELIKTLVRNDLKSRYAGSFLGLIWAFIQPIMTILVFWLVYELGFRTLPVDNVKFILWFIPAYIPWVFFSDAITNTSNCLREYSYLVKKMKFKVEILPVIKLLTSLVIHFFFVSFMLFIYVFYKYKITGMIVQLIYYAAALLVLLMGLAWLTAAISVFMKDLTQVITIILQIGFFVIPIFWNDADMSPKVLFFLKFNPVFYIVQGYRDSLINGICFWDKPVLTAYYWIVTLVVFWVGAALFHKTRKHFADLI